MRIVALLNEQEAGVGTEGCAAQGVSQETVYRWKVNKAVEDENRRLKRLVADLVLDNAALEDMLSKTGEPRGLPLGSLLPASRLAT